MLSSSKRSSSKNRGKGCHGLSMSQPQPLSPEKVWFFLIDRFLDWDSFEFLNSHCSSPRALYLFAAEREADSRSLVYLLEDERWINHYHVPFTPQFIASLMVSWQPTLVLVPARLLLIMYSSFSPVQRLPRVEMQEVKFTCITGDEGEVVWCRGITKLKVVHGTLIELEVMDKLIKIKFESKVFSYCVIHAI